jgi:hypothetical protein
MTLDEQVSIRMRGLNVAMSSTLNAAYDDDDANTITMNAILIPSKRES